jgi:hypothetical protein
MERKFFDDLGNNFVMMSRPRFIQEHKNLLGVLQRKNPKELDAEARDQKKELQAELKKKKKGSK